MSSGTDIELTELCPKNPTSPKKPTGGNVDPPFNPNVTIRYRYVNKTSGICNYELYFLDTNGLEKEESSFDGVFISQFSYLPPDEFIITICDESVRSLTFFPANTIPDDCTLKINLINTTTNKVDVVINSPTSQQLQMKICPPIYSSIDSMTTVNNILRFNDSTTTIQTNARLTSPPPPCGTTAVYTEATGVHSIPIQFDPNYTIDPNYAELSFTGGIITPL